MAKSRVFLFLLVLILMGSDPRNSAALWAQMKGVADGKAKAATPVIQNGIPAHPKDLAYAPLHFVPPKREIYRHVLSNGVVAYLVEDHDLPLVNLSLIVRAGRYLAPVGKEGLAALTGSQIRAGGTATKTAEVFDEAADFLAAQISASVGDTQGGAALNCLSKDIDEGLKLFFDMLKNPGFQADRLALAKSQILQEMERRNDETPGIESREWNRLMQGEQHFSTKPSTKASIDSITRADLQAFHKAYFHPGNFIFAVSGDFKTTEMKRKLETFLQGWEIGKTPVPEIPKPTATPVPGVYAVHKVDVNQGRVTLGHIGSMRDNPDAYALTMMNDILGGGGFTSRITSRVRSDEGLAYDAGSAFGLGVYYPGVFRASFQSKSPTCAQAIDIVLQEINRIRTEKVSPAELETAINNAIEIFPRYFSSAAKIAGTFAADEFTARPAGYWDTYRDKIKAVTAEEVLRVAQKYLQPDKLAILIVGHLDDIMKGNPDKPQHAIARLSKDGRIQRIPLPDPLTMVYPKAP
ncbi:MAG: insulinase family protein [Acidobacteria bacterium]|nr:insulinase family protein [Acidobacteriota bacterium]MBI3658007.1 insulinase family protein [Acidobacteriota bacterium]